MSGQNLLTWMDGREMQPIALLAWAGKYDDRGTILTRDVARIREILAAVSMPWRSYETATFPDGIEGFRVWTASEVLQVSNNDDGGHDFEVLDRDPPGEPDREWGPRP
ncbi:hypothetical protein [Methylorubrum sp. DB1722]|uniref:hypothetical protein n=1 Tax=Methylorubrum sp. DB1722 TaxID=2478916 RepID=UPI0018E3CF5A|nr:hypothetical protein [Methylorubrum sp. DB1722]MBI1689489.1 hypothetical protein [Methylorubrum sp. DB1722]